MWWCSPLSHLLLWFGLCIGLALPLHLIISSKTEPASPLLTQHQQQQQLQQIYDAPLDLIRLMFSMYPRLSSARSKKHKKPKYPVSHKLIIDRLGFGNLSFNLGFTINFQVSNSIGFNRRFGPERVLNVAYS